MVQFFIGLGIGLPIGAIIMFLVVVILQIKNMENDEDYTEYE